MNTNILKNNLCTACGKTVKNWIIKKIISKDLAKAWELSAELQEKFNLRESQFCPNCGNSLRTRIFAQAIMNAFPINKTNNLKEWVRKSKQLNLKVAEINACGKLHKILSRIKNISYSEYPPARVLPRLYLFLKRIVQNQFTGKKVDRTREATVVINTLY